MLRPAAARDSGFSVEAVGEQEFVVSGERPGRWVLQTDFNNDEAVGYLADRLARLGVEDELAKLGARKGAEVTIGSVTFDWEPTLRSGVGVPYGGRGTDARLEDHSRVGADERKASRKARRTAYDEEAEARATRGGRRRRRGVVSREVVANARRLVVKIGSSSLASPGGGIDAARIDALVDATAARVVNGGQVILVSSGAIAAGLKPLGLSTRPRDLATQQAAASVGQGMLVAHYSAAYARHDLTVGQVLLTADDVVRRAHYRNAARTFERLLGLGVVPVVNENDTVATEEIRFGDNDRLAALVTHLVRADALVLLSDVDGVYDDDPAHGAATPGERRAQRRRPRPRPARLGRQARRGQRRDGDEGRRGPDRGGRRRSDPARPHRPGRAGAGRG